MNIDLKELTQLAPIFRELFKGYHISRSNPELYTQLASQQDQYRGLFKALGYELTCDSRGFYYFVPEQMGAQVNKTAQRLALFTFILIEHLADQGRDPRAIGLCHPRMKPQRIGPFNRGRPRYPAFPCAHRRRRPLKRRLQRQSACQISAMPNFGHTSTP